MILNNYLVFSYVYVSLNILYWHYFEKDLHPIKKETPIALVLMFAFSPATCIMLLIFQVRTIVKVIYKTYLKIIKRSN